MTSTTMNEAYLMSDSVTASTFIVTKAGELLTFEEYQKSKETNNQNTKSSTSILFTPCVTNDNDLKKAQGILLDSQQNMSSRTTIKNMLAGNNNLEAGNITLDCLTKTVHNNTNLNKSSLPQPDHYENNNTEQRGGLEKRTKLNTSPEIVSNLLDQLNAEKLSDSQLKRAEEIYKDLLAELSELTKFDSRDKNFNGPTEIELLRHTNMYLTQIQNEVLFLQKKLEEDHNMMHES